MAHNTNHGALKQVLQGSGNVFCCCSAGRFAAALCTATCTEISVHDSEPSLTVPVRLFVLQHTLSSYTALSTVSMLACSGDSVYAACQGGELVQLRVRLDTAALFAEEGK